MSARFITKLEVTPLPDGINWRLAHDLKFIDARGDLHKVPAGFVTDFASIPDLDRVGVVVASIGATVLAVGSNLYGAGGKLHWLDLAGILLFIAGFAIIWICPDLNRDDQLDAPATLHDEGYRRPRYGRGAWLLKFYWDWILFQAMRANREPLWKCWLIWFNVAAFGWLAWYQDGRSHAATKHHHK